MVSFVCDVCQDTLKKAKLDQHKGRCHGASFSCIDCGTSFKGAEHRAHTSCISEAEKYEKSVFKGPKKSKMNGAGDSIKKDGQILPEKPRPIVEQIKKKTEEKQGKLASAAEVANGGKQGKNSAADVAKGKKHEEKVTVVEAATGESQREKAIAAKVAKGEKQEGKVPADEVAKEEKQGKKALAADVAKGEKQRKKDLAAEAAKGEKQSDTPNKRKADTKELAAGDKEDSFKKPKVSEAAGIKEAKETENKKENGEVKVLESKEVNEEEMTLKIHDKIEGAKEMENKLKNAKKNKKDKQELKDEVAAAEISETTGQENEFVAEPAEKKDIEMVDCEQGDKQDVNSQVARKRTRRRGSKNRSRSAAPRSSESQLAAVNVTKEIKEVLKETGGELSFNALHAIFRERYKQSQNLATVEKMIDENVKLVFKDGIVRMV